MDMAVGIELQNDRVSVAVLCKKANMLTLQFFETIQAEDVFQLQEELRRIFAKNRIFSHYTTVSVPIQNTILRKFSVDFTDPQQIDQIIYYETENYIHTQEIEDLIIDYYILQTTGDKTRLSVAAVKKEVIAKQLKFVENCDVYPFILDLDVFSLFYLCQINTDYKEKNYIVLQVEENFCNFLLIVGGKVQDVRSLLMRSSWFAESITREINSTTEIKIDELAHENSSIDITKYQEKLFKELQPVFVKVASVDHMYFCGNDYLAKKLTSAFAKLHLPCSKWDLSKDIQKFASIPSDKISSSYIPIGLVLRSLGTAEGCFNFRKDDFAYKNSLDITRTPFAILLTMLFFYSCYSKQLLSL